MKKLIYSTILGASLTFPIREGLSNVDHARLVEDISQKTQVLLELKKEQEINLKLQKIQETIDDNIDKNESRVLLIGINNYKHIVGLATPRNDVKMIKKLLVQKYGIKKENITIILDERASKIRILAKMKEIEKSTPDDKKMIIYFSGHGVALDDKGRGVANFNKGNYSGYISPFEADIHYSKKYKCNIYDKQTRISRKDINKAIGYKQENLLILDSCYGGAMAKGSKDNEVLVTASNKEVAISSRKTSKRKTSLFSNAVFQIITGNRQDSIGSAIVNSRDKVNEIATLEKSSQEPIIKIRKITLNVRKTEFKEIN